MSFFAALVFFDAFRFVVCDKKHRLCFTDLLLEKLSCVVVVEILEPVLDPVSAAQLSVVAAKYQPDPHLAPSTTAIDNRQKWGPIGTAIGDLASGGLPRVQQRAATTTATTTARATTRVAKRRCVLGRLSDGDLRRRRRVRLEPGHDGAGREEFPRPLVPFGDVVGRPSPVLHRLLHFHFRCRCHFFRWW